MRALYDVTARVQSDDHASITYGLGQRFRFGAPKKPKSELLQEKRVTLKAVSFTAKSRSARTCSGTRSRRRSATT
jgi:hypothetical protein